MYINKPATVVFDPSDKTHRAAVRAFMKRRAWVDSPIRFTHDPGYGSISEQVQTKLLNWFVAQEEAKEVKRVMKTIEKSGFAALTLEQSLLTAQERGMLPPPGYGDKELAFAMMGVASEYKP
jgi:hypothetical protein